MIAAKRPAFRLESNAPDTKPTRVGPPAQPRSPARAKMANMAVPPDGHADAARENVPGQRMPTEKPVSAQPAKDKSGKGERAVTA